MFDLIFLKKYVEEIKSDLVNARVDKIYQPGSLELTLSLRNPGETLNFRIDCTATGNNFRITDQLPQNPTSPSAFCMLLRKYLVGSKVRCIDLVDNERIINISFQGRHPEGYVTSWILSLELMGKHSNLIFYHEETESILGLLKHTTSSVRDLKVGSSYQLPPTQSKLTFKDFNPKSLFLAALGDEALPLDKIIIKYFPLSSPVLTKEFIYKKEYRDLILSELTDTEVSDLIEKYICFAQKAMYEPVMYFSKDNNEIYDFYCMKLDSLDASRYDHEIYPSYRKLVQDFYDVKEMEGKLESFKSQLNKVISKQHKRLTKKFKALSKELIQYENSGQFKELGDLIMSNLHQIKKGMTEVTVFNYYSSLEEKIKLDPSLSPIANSQAYYKKHSKAKRGLEIVRSNLEGVKNELDYLDSLNHFILNGDFNELTEIEHELIKGGYIKPPKEVKGNKKKIDVSQTKPLEFISSQGFEILVGKNNRQNDLLTLKTAKKGDIWLHTKDIAGSHVIIKNGADAPEETLIEAATLAAYYSKAKQSANVAVDYADVKNVFKPKGAKPGMVNYFEFKTIYVTPKENVVEQLKKSR